MRIGESAFGARQYVIEFQSSAPVGTLPERVLLNVHAEACTGAGEWEREPDPAEAADSTYE